MRKGQENVSVERIKEVHSVRHSEIRKRISEFEAIWQNAGDDELWAEMVFCFFTGGCSARMGLRSIEAAKPLLENGTWAELAAALKGVHRYPNARSRYIVESRKFLRSDCGFRIRERLSRFECPLERRDWLATEKGIKGLGFKEASHFLRNIGLKGYGILDKHVLRCLAELKIIDEPKPPNSRSAYLRVEEALKELSATVEIDFDELDLVLWSMKTGEILK